MEIELRKELTKMSKKERESIVIAAVARDHGVSRTTVYNHIKSLGVKKERKKRKSVLDEYKTLIDLKNDGAHSAESIFRYLKKNTNYGGSYALVRDYIRESNKDKKKIIEAFVFKIYNTPGLVFQVDWKERKTLRTKDGEVTTYDVFSMASPFSLNRYYEFVLEKKIDTLIRCITNALIFFGGVPETIIFDNMKTVVQSINYFDNTKTFTDAMINFAHNFGFKIHACAPGKGNQKATVETGNKILDDIDLYDNELNNKYEIIELVKHLQEVANKDRDEKFGLERSVLQPLPSQAVIEQFLKLPGKRKVDTRSLVTFDKQQYMVSPKFVGEDVHVYIRDGKVEIEHLGTLIESYEYSGNLYNVRKEYIKEIIQQEKYYRMHQNIENWTDFYYNQFVTDIEFSPELSVGE